MKDIQNIIWDWNGTLINDVEICIETLNVLLEQREMPVIRTDHYKNHFTFPVRLFYEKIGFNFTNENFEVVSEEYISTYLELFRKATLYKNSIDTLKFFKRRGLVQFVLSAMEFPDLMNSIYQKGIKHYFKSIYGSSDKFAEGKLTVAERLFKKEKIIPEDTLLIGDTLHDWEVASKMGCQVVLISDGHQTRQRLSKSKVPVLEHMSDVINLFM